MDPLPPIWAPSGQAIARTSRMQITVMRIDAPCLPAPIGRLGIGLEIAQSELDAGQKVLQHPWIPKGIGVVPQRAVEHTPLPITADPAQRIFAIFTVTLTGAAALIHICLRYIDAE